MRQAIILLLAIGATRTDAQGISVIAADAPSLTNPGLFCSTGTINCGNFNGLGYKTTGGGQCGADPGFIGAPTAGQKYPEYWCGSFYVGVMTNWVDPKLVKPVWQFVGGEQKTCTSNSKTFYKCTGQRYTAGEDKCDCISNGVFGCSEFNVG